MGPNDPFSPLSSEAPPQSRPADGLPPDGRAVPPGQVRVEARSPDPPSVVRRAGRAPLAGAVAGLVLGGLVVTVGVGPALVVLLCVAVGAALGAVVQAAFADGVDLAAAWRALRRR